MDKQQKVSAPHQVGTEEQECSSGVQHLPGMGEALGSIPNITPLCWLVLYTHGQGVGVIRAEVLARTWKALSHKAYSVLFLPQHPAHLSGLLRALTMHIISAVSLLIGK